MNRSDINLMNEYFNIIRGNQLIFQNISYYASRCNTDATEVLNNYFTKKSNRVNIVGLNN